MTQESLSYMDKSVSDIDRILANMDKPKPSQQQQYWRDRADELAIKCKASMAVVNNGGTYQVWHVSKAGRGHEYIAEYGGNTDDNN